MKYRKKPVVIEAIHFYMNYQDVIKFCPTAQLQVSDDLNTRFIIPTLEGDHIANKGDYIIKGVKGEFYPCKPDIFEMTYEKHEELNQ